VKKEESLLEIDCSKVMLSSRRRSSLIQHHRVSTRQQEALTVSSSDDAMAALTWTAFLLGNAFRATHAASGRQTETARCSGRNASCRTWTFQPDAMLDG